MIDVDDRASEQFPNVRGLRNQNSAADPLHTAAERQKLLVDWNETQTEYPKDVPLASLIEDQVERSPQSIAVISGDQQFTFNELNQRANQLAYHLRSHGAGPDHLIGVCLDRTFDLVVTLLAIIKAGAAYVPIDPLLPSERIQYLLEDSGIRILVVGQALLDQLPPFDGVLISPEDEAWRNNSAQNLAVTVDPKNLAYLIYTSGSTGKPKGVQIPRQALTNFLCSMRDSLQVGAADHILAVTTISFDMSGTEMWLPLVVGARMILATREDAADGNLLRDLIERNDITFMQATPITWRLLFLTGWKHKPNLQVICGGEAMPPDLAAQLVPAVKRLWNMYGPTETTIWSTGYVVTDAAAPILVGRPIANTRCYILDDQLQPVPVGVTGELYIGGDGLAIGYLNRPELNSSSFIPDPFLGGSTRMYRTGDLARFHPDSNIECLGRIDHQIKLRGYRIELGEIEAALREIPEILDAVVTLREDQPGDQRLVAYFVPSVGGCPTTADILRRLKLTLPIYMIPTVFQTLEKLPTTTSGKVDRKALPAPQAQEFQTDQAHESPRGAVQEILTRIWCEVLDIRSVGIHDDYFELGGDSLRAVRLILKIREAFPESKPSLATFLRSPTIEQFARSIAGGEADWSCLVPVREGTLRTPFFCVHGAGGNWMSMRALAMAMPSNQPFYCLQARGLDGRTAPFSTVEETAESYLEDIRRVQPQGPYNLGGGCYGGLVAFEMACRLRSMGERVSVLALIDSENDSYSQLIPKTRVFYFKARFILRRTIHHLRQLENVDRSGRFEYLRRRVKMGWRAIFDLWKMISSGTASPNSAEAGNQNVEVQPAGAAFDKTLEVVRNASILAGQKFVPKPYDSNVLVFRAKQRPDDPYSDMALGWGPVVFGGITVHEVDANHIDIFHEPAVRTVAELLDAELTAREFDLDAHHRA
jgi:amino acid adenylation domain-containing protein